MLLFEAGQEHDKQKNRMKDLSKSAQNMLKRHVKSLENTILKTRNHLFQDEAVTCIAAVLAQFWKWGQT